jgi:predicted dienelactone hydrolase
MKTPLSSFHTRVFLWITCLALCVIATQAIAYDPMALPSEKSTTASPASTPLDITIHDTKRNRDIPIRIFLPTTTTAVPVVIFSHGLGGNREGSAYLGQHWSARGYAVVYVQHPGSDDSLWKNAEPSQRMAALKAGANLQNLLLRIADIPAVLDQLTAWNNDTSNSLHGRLDLTHVGMSGHSFGAQTTQAVSGQSFPGDVGQRFTDPRICAAVAFSPNIAKVGTPRTGFGSVKIPWMLMTGTKDVSPVGGATPESRQQVYTALPAGDKYEVVLNNAEHSAFTDRALPGDSEPRNPNHHRVILALSTAFWDAYLKNDTEAKAWLAGKAPRALMESADQWAKK